MGARGGRFFALAASVAVVTGFLVPVQSAHAVPSRPTRTSPTSTSSAAVQRKPRPGTVHAASPAPTGVSPTSGQEYTTVAISGTGFTGATQVTFGTQPVPFNVLSDTKILAEALGVTGTTPTVSVTTSGGTGTSSVGLFTFTATYSDGYAPYVSSIDPPDGPAGTTVTVEGGGFSGVTAVEFGGVAATSYTVTQDGELTAVAPSGTSGSEVPVTVTTAKGTSQGGPSFGYHPTVTSATTPAIVFLQPNVGPSAGGMPVLLEGSGMASVTTVKFGSVTANSVEHISDTQIGVIEPAGTAGTTVDVTAISSGGTSPISSQDHFTFSVPPTVTSLSVTSGSAGTQLTINGTGFTSLPEYGSASLFGTGCLVSFGSLCAAQSNIVSSTQIAATVPSGGSGTVDVTVTTSDGTSATSSSDQFTYTLAVPTVTSAYPAQGATGGGTTVYVNGSGFTGATAVKFGSSNATGIVVYSDDSLSAVTPPGTGSVAISVTAPGGTGTSSGALFTYEPAPTVTSVSPSSGPVSGGNAVVVDGTGFVAVTQVLFGSTPAAYTTLSPTQLSVSVPAGVGGSTVDITVAAAGGQSTSGGPDQYTYDAGPPGVNSLYPSDGPLGGGTVVGVSGNGFGTGTTVDFGSTASSTVTVYSSTYLTAVAPAGTAGAVDVTVTNGSGTSVATPADQFTYLGVPTVSSVSPNTGSTAGGSTVTISGSGFTDVSAVSFGTNQVSGSWQVLSQGTIVVPVPSSATGGAVDVTVTTAGGTSATSSSDTFTYVSNPPEVTGLGPGFYGGLNDGGSLTGPVAGGTQLTIFGQGFTAATAVHFGTLAAHFTVVSGTEIDVTSPQAATPGAVDVTVTNAAGTSATTGADLFTYEAAPTVSGISPSSGPAAGGTLVTVTGTGFRACEVAYVCTVDFGTTPSADVVDINDTTMTVLSPAAAAGSVADLTVTSTGGTSSVSSADRFTYGAATAPVVTSVSGSGLAGDGAYVTGSGFTTATAVYFGTTPAAFTPQGDSSILVTVPAQGANPSTVDVTVVNPAGTSALTPGDKFTYASGAPAISSLSPSSGPDTGGTVVTISGSNLDGVDSVYVGGQSATIVGQSSTAIAFEAPAAPPGTVDVQVIGPGGFSTLGASDQYTYTLATPTVSSLGYVSQGPSTGGTTLQVTGTGLYGLTAVDFGTIPAASFVAEPSFGGGSPTLMAVSPPNSPAGAGGTVDVTATNASGTSPTSAADEFTYIAGSAPQVTGVSPSSGPAAGGTLVTITGTGFSSATSVSFGSFGYGGASYTVNSDTSITVVSPAGEPGQSIDIRVGGPAGQSPSVPGDEFTYTGTDTPVVNGVFDSTGPAAGGSTVTIVGSGFDGATSVMFGSTPASSFTVGFGGGDITAVVPAQGANPATVDVTVTVGSATSSTNLFDQFTWVPAPTVTSVSPGSGDEAGGGTVTVSGTNLDTVSGVTFGGAAATTTSQTSTAITVTVPAHAPGSVDVTVTGPGGTATKSGAYTYTAGAPTITAVSPNGGSPAGDNTVTITGTDLFSASAVDFGGVAASIVSSSSDGTSLTAFLQPGASAGTTVDVTVTTPGGTSAVVPADQYTFQAAPTITSLNPTNGAMAGTNIVTISGTNLSNVEAVYFGTAQAALTATGNGTSVSVGAPPHASGTVDVTVTTPGGSATATGAYTYNSGAPVVTSVSPPTGPESGGTNVEVVGGGFFGVSGVDFGSTPVTPSYVSPDGSYLYVTSPVGSGTEHITVVASAGTSTTSSADQYTYQAPPVLPQITGLSTNTCSTAGGDPVQITGSGFTGATAVLFGGVYAFPTSVTDSLIDVTCPPQGAITVDVTVQTPSGTSKVDPSVDQITYSSAAPAVTSISPQQGSATGGTAVYVFGTSFFGVTAVDFGTTPATVTSISPDGTSLQVTAPAESAGTVDVTVVTSGGTSSTGSQDQFTYGATPTVSSLDTTTGDADGGTTVTITGTGFTSASAVYFGNAYASPTVNSDTSITVSSPPNPAGTVDVTVVTPFGTSATNPGDQFTYTLAAPTITGLYPDAGPTAGGNDVTIFGTDLFDVSSVTVGGTNATIVSPSLDGTSLDVTAPAGPTLGGAATVVVTNSTGTDTANPTGADQYTYVVPPTATSLSATSGPDSGGTSVTITGSGFDYCAASSANLSNCTVDFGGNTTIADSATSTSITATAPPHAAGAVTVTVTTPGGTSSPSQQFSYIAEQPTVTLVSPNYGTPNGGDSVTVSGTSLFGVTSVLFGGVSATVTSTDPYGQYVSVTTPPGTNGTTVDVTVTAEGGTSAANPGDQFTYLALIIRQFRLSGPNGAGDQYVELYNPSTSVTIDNLSSWQLAYDGGSVYLTGAASLGPRQAYLIAGPDYSLSGLALPDQTLSSPIPEISGVEGTGGLQLIDPNGNPLEAVGTSGASTGYFSGTPLTGPASPSDDYTYSRVESNGAPIDTGNNASDFVIDDPGATMAGSVDGVPDPSDMASPVWNNLNTYSDLVDTSVSASTSPNQTYVAGTPGTLTIDRTITNTGSSTMNTMELYISTMSVAGQNVTGQAELEVQDSTGGTVSTVCCGGSVDVSGLTMLQSDGGGIGTLLSVPLPGGGLAPGSSISVTFSFKVLATGHYYFGYDVLTN